ncbi:MAG: ABC transporter ATP-binding protein [Firmicutes bacterium]|nr:ABC transporter ATP-binding protein [Bacillota bacterium]
MTDMPKILEFKDISFAYPGQKLLFDDLNVSFAAGQITAVLGPNGCGKSTLLKLACRLLAPGSGQIILNGREISGYTRRDFAQKITLLSQRYTLPDITVQELVSYGRYPYGQHRGLSAADKQAIMAAVEQTDLQALQTKYLREISGGQAQRAFIAMALAQDTDVLLLDEPINSLDIHVGFEVMELLTRLKKGGKTVIMVLHDLALALQYADNILLLSGGRPVAEGTPAEILAGGEILQVFGVQPHALAVGDKRLFAFSNVAELADKL